jgi:hypothetical protein
VLDKAVLFFGLWHDFLGKSIKNSACQLVFVGLKFSSTARDTTPLDTRRYQATPSHTASIDFQPTTAQESRMNVKEKIGELRIRCRSAHGLTEFADVVATDFDVKIEFSYTPGDEGKLDGRFEDAVEPSPPEIDIRAIRADAAVHFDGEGVRLTAERGTDLLELFSHTEIMVLEDRLLARAEAGSVE